MIKRFGKLFNKKLLLKLYKEFVLPHFRYCSLIWHFCGKRNTEKLEYLNRRILRYIFQDKESSYDDLLSQTNISTLKSIKYLAAKSWNSLTDDIRTITDIYKFKTEIKRLDFPIPS